jgi:hypothetical protein
MIVPIHHVHETWHHSLVWHISMELEKNATFDDIIFVALYINETTMTIY